jgi:hypothetical protein
MRPDAHFALTDCIGRFPCGPPGDIETVCMAEVTRLAVSPLGGAVRQNCLARTCGVRTAAQCAVAPWFHDQALQQIQGCLAIPACADAGRCVEHTLDRWGCP